MVHRAMNTTAQAVLLEGYPALRTLSVARLRRMLESAQALRLPAGYKLFDDGDACARHPFFIEGRVRVWKRGSDGDEILLYEVSPGETCALSVVGLLGGTTYSATGTVETDALLYVIPRETFLDLVLECPAFRSFVFSALSHRVSHLMSLVDDVVFHRVAYRVAASLLRAPQPIEVTHQMLADQLGTRREVVSRILGRFQRSGLVRLGRKRIEILDPHALRVSSVPRE
jgi:CRP/FNR family transcriptional regulator, anaerobic regulatory protein